VLAALGSVGFDPPFDLELQPLENVNWLNWSKSWLTGRRLPPQTYQGFLVIPWNKLFVNYYFLMPASSVEDAQERQLFNSSS